MAKYERPSAVLFDMDGLLIDSETIYTTVVNDVLRPYGKEQTFEIKATLMGMPERKATETLLAALWPPRADRQGEVYNVDECPFEIDTFLRDRNAQLLKAFETVKPMPGALRLVKHLQKHQIPICVATGSKTPNYKIKSGANPELFAPFEGRAVCGDDSRLNRGKPFPDIFLLAAREGLGIEAMKDKIREQGEQHDGELKGGEKSVLVFEDATVSQRSPLEETEHILTRSCVFRMASRLLSKPVCKSFGCQSPLSLPLWATTSALQ